MTVLEKNAEARKLREAVVTLEIPPLEPSAFARIVARRAAGDRVSLLTDDVPGAHTRHTRIIAGALAALAASIIVLLALHSSKPLDRFALDPADAACANFSTTPDSSALRQLMISAFGVSAACGAQPAPDAPVTISPSQIEPGEYTYSGVSITDRVFTSVHKPRVIRISRTTWRGTQALLIARFAPIVTGVHLDSLFVSLADLSPLHYASWYPTQHPVGSLQASFDTSMVTIVMRGRFDTVATFPYRTEAGELPFGWTAEVVVPALSLSKDWHGTVRISVPIHPHAYKLAGKPWESMSLRVIGREYIRVGAGTFDCWKLRVGEPEDQSFMWVSTSRHFVVRSQTTYHLGDTEFEDRVDLGRMVSGYH